LRLRAGYAYFSLLPLYYYSIILAKWEGEAKKRVKSPQNTADRGRQFFENGEKSKENAQKIKLE